MKNRYILSKSIKLCLVTNYKNQGIEAYLQFIESSVKGGVSMVQLREKEASSEKLVHFAFKLKIILDQYKTPLIINDDPVLAAEIDAKGVHLGQNDMHPDEARKILGKDKIIGLSVETLEQLAEANKLKSVDYVAASAIFSSKTKVDCRTFWGVSGLRQFCNMSRHPVMAIGGINNLNVEHIVKAGAKGVAVVGAIHDSHYPEKAASELINGINHHLSRSSCLMR